MRGDGDNVGNLLQRQKLVRKRFPFMIAHVSGRRRCHRRLDIRSSTTIFVERSISRMPYVKEGSDTDEFAFVNPSWRVSWPLSSR